MFDQIRQALIVVFGERNTINTQHIDDNACQKRDIAR